MSKDLARLFEEGESQNGNEKSKKICGLLETWLMKGLKKATNDHLFTNHLIRRTDERGNK